MRRLGVVFGRCGFGVGICCRGAGVGAEVTGLCPHGAGLGTVGGLCFGAGVFIAAFCGIWA